MSVHKQDAGVVVGIAMNSRDAQPNLPAPVPRPFLFEDELVERYAGRLAKSTLEKWRSAGEGPQFAYVGRVPVYPLVALVEWELALPLFRTASEARADNGA